MAKMFGWKSCATVKLSTVYGPENGDGDGWRRLRIHRSLDVREVIRAQSGKQGRENGASFYAQQMATAFFLGARPGTHHGCSGRRSFRYRDVFHCRRAARNEPSLDGPPDLAAHGGGADDVRANRHGPGRRTGRGASKAHSETLRYRRNVLSSSSEHNQHRG